MTKEEHLIKIHETSIEELKKTHVEFSESYKETNKKVLTFMGGELAILSFLYNKNDLFFPKEIYGRIFYITGLCLSVLALTLLFMAIQPVQWNLPIERKKHYKISQKNFLKYLKYIKETYLNAIEGNLVLYERKQKYLNFAVSSLVIGVILLLVIKNFNY